MRKYLILAVVAFMSVSCLDHSTYYSSQRTEISFEYFNENEIFPNEETDHYCGPFYVGAFNFYANMGKDEANPEFQGGVSICRVADTTIVTRTTPYSHFVVLGTPAEEGKLGEANVFLTYYDNPDTTCNPASALSYVYSYMGYATATSIDVNNTLEMYAIVKGCTELPAFKSGDWVKVSFGAYLDDAFTKKVDCMMVDYTGVEPKIVTEWTTVDLSSLGQFHYLKIWVESNVEGIPPYVCLDNFKATAVIGSED